MPIGISAPRERQCPRLHGFDYASRRWYFVTVCTLGGHPLLGGIQADGVRLTESGEIVEEEWRRSASLRADLLLDAFVVMPDHVHGLVGLRDAPPAGRRSSLPGLMSTFKAAVTRRLHRQSPGQYGGIWQRSYHDSIIRSSRQLERVRAYIQANPRKAWEALIRSGGRSEIRCRA
jgi:REP element-mobilizing transposase RayT